MSKEQGLEEEDGEAGFSSQADSRRAYFLFELASSRPSLAGCIVPPSLSLFPSFFNTRELSSSLCLCLQACP